MVTPYQEKQNFLNYLITILVIANTIWIIGGLFWFGGYPFYPPSQALMAIALLAVSMLSFLNIRKMKNYRRNMEKIVGKEKPDLFGPDVMLKGVREDLRKLRKEMREEADGMRADIREEMEEWGIGDPFLKQYRERAKKRIEKRKITGLENLGSEITEMVNRSLKNTLSHTNNISVGTKGDVNISGNGKIVVGGVDITKQVKRMGGDGSNISIIDDPARGGFIIKSGKKQIYLDKEGLELDRQYDQAMEELGYTVPKKRPKPKGPQLVPISLKGFFQDIVLGAFKDLFKRRNKKATRKDDLHVGDSDSNTGKIDLARNPLED